MRDAETFDEEFLKKLQLLELVARRARAAGLEGRQAGARRGGLIEFADHRRYSPGDDLRYLDWNLYARLERLFLKEFSREEDRLVLLLLDESRSMGAGSPPKRRCGARLVAALAFVALAGGNRARLARLSGGAAVFSDVLTGDNRLGDALDFLSRPFAAGGTDLGASLAACYKETGRPVMVILATDLYDEGGPGRMLEFLSAKGYEVVLLHLLGPEEREPRGRGKIRFTDAESGEVLEIPVGEAELGLYAREMEAFLSGWRAFCLKHGVRYLPVSTAVPLEETVLRCLRAEGFLR